MNLALFICLSMVLHSDIGHPAAVSGLVHHPDIVGQLSQLGLSQLGLSQLSAVAQPGLSVAPLGVPPGGVHGTEAAVAAATPSASGEAAANDNPKNNRGVFEMPTLGRPVVLGELYSTHSDLFIPSFSLWDQSTIKKNTEITWIPSERVEFESGETKDKAYEHFKLTASLSVSYDAGMIHVAGSAGYLQTKQTDDENAHVRLSYISRTRAESISTDITGTAAPRCNDKNGNPITTKGPYAPTHVVAQIVYGGNAHFDFMKEVRDSKKRTKIQGELTVTINLELDQIHGHADFHYHNNENKTSEDIQIKLFTDFLVTDQPTTVNESITLYKETSQYFGNRANGFNGSVPISVSLIPIEQYCPTAKGLAKKISEAIFKDAVSHYLQLQKTLKNIEKLLATHAATFNFPIRALLLDFEDKVDNYTLTYGEKLVQIIPLVRSDPTNTITLDKLHKLTQGYLRSCFDYDKYLYEYLSIRTREVNAINIFYTQTINKAAPQISQFKEAEIAEAMITMKAVFILTLNVIPNTKDQFFDTKYCGNDTTKETTAWYNHRNTTGHVGHTWRQFLAFYTANYKVTKSGKESAFFIDILPAESKKLPVPPAVALYLYLDGKHNGEFQVPEILKKKPVVCRGVKRQMTLFVDNPKLYNNKSSQITHVTVNYTMAVPNVAPSYKTATVGIEPESTNSTTTKIVIEHINSEESYDFTVSYMTKYGAGPPSKVFTTYGPLGELRRTPRCSLEVDNKFISLTRQGNFQTVSECAAEALKLAKASSIPTTSTKAFWWSYNFATRNCYTINLTKTVGANHTVGWVSGSPACGVKPTNGYELWTAWEAWSASDNGTQTRSRTCLATSPCKCGGENQELKSMRTVFTQPSGELELTRNTTLATLPTLGKEWEITFQFKPTNYSGYRTFTNLIHLTIGGEATVLGDRTPAIFFDPDFGMQVATAIGDSPDYNIVINPHQSKPPVGEWSTLTLTQLKSGTSTTFSVTINGVDGFLPVENPTPQEFSNVKVYASDPFNPAQPGLMKNLVIKTSV